MQNRFPLEIITDIGMKLQGAQIELQHQQKGANWTRAHIKNRRKTAGTLITILSNAAWDLEMLLF